MTLGNSGMKAKGAEKHAKKIKPTRGPRPEVLGSKEKKVKQVSLAPKNPELEPFFAVRSVYHGFWNISVASAYASMLGYALEYQITKKLPPLEGLIPLANSAYNCHEKSANMPSDVDSRTTAVFTARSSLVVNIVLSITATAAGPAPTLPSFKAYCGIHQTATASASELVRAVFDKHGLPGVELTVPQYRKLLQELRVNIDSLSSDYAKLRTVMPEMVKSLTDGSFAANFLKMPADKQKDLKVIVCLCLAAIVGLESVLPGTHKTYHALVSSLGEGFDDEEARGMFKRVKAMTSRFTLSARISGLLGQLERDASRFGEAVPEARDLDTKTIISAAVQSEDRRDPPIAIVAEGGVTFDSVTVQTRNQQLVQVDTTPPAGDAMRELASESGKVVVQSRAIKAREEDEMVEVKISSPESNSETEAPVQPSSDAGFEDWIAISPAQMANPFVASIIVDAIARTMRLNVRTDGDVASSYLDGSMHKVNRIMTNLLDCVSSPSGLRMSEVMSIKEGTVMIIAESSGWAEICDFERKNCATGDSVPNKKAEAKTSTITMGSEQFSKPLQKSLQQFEQALSDCIKVLPGPGMLGIFVEAPWITNRRKLFTSTRTHVRHLLSYWGKTVPSELDKVAASNIVAILSQLTAPNAELAIALGAVKVAKGSRLYPFMMKYGSAGSHSSIDRSLPNVELFASLADIHDMLSAIRVPQKTHAFPLPAHWNPTPLPIRVSNAVAAAVVTDSSDDTRPNVFVVSGKHVTNQWSENDPDVVTTLRAKLVGLVQEGRLSLAFNLDADFSTTRSSTVRQAVKVDNFTAVQKGGWCWFFDQCSIQLCSASASAEVVGSLKLVNLSTVLTRTSARSKGHVKEALVSWWSGSRAVSSLATADLISHLAGGLRKVHRKKYAAGISAYGRTKELEGYALVNQVREQNVQLWLLNPEERRGVANKIFGGRVVVHETLGENGERRRRPIQYGNVFAALLHNRIEWCADCQVATAFVEAQISAFVGSRSVDHFMLGDSYANNAEIRERMKEGLRTAWNVWAGDNLPRVLGPNGPR